MILEDTFGVAYFGGKTAILQGERAGLRDPTQEWRGSGGTTKSTAGRVLIDFGRTWPLVNLLVYLSINAPS